MPSEVAQSLLVEVDRGVDLARDLLGSASSTAERHALYTTGVLAVACELAEGVAAETRAARLHNATRLARHLLEYDIELTYVLLNPERRLEQRVNTEVRTFVERPADRLPVGRSRSALEGRLAAARQAEEAGKRAAKDAGRKVAADDHAFTPSYEVMASAIDRSDDYESYRVMSAYSHPGLLAHARHLVLEDPDGTVHAWGTKSDEHHEQILLCQTLGCLINCIHGATWAHGLDADTRLADLEAQRDSLYADVARR